MGKGLIRSLRRGGAKSPIVRKTYTLNALALSMTGATGVGWGTAVLGDVPEGNISILGAMLDCLITESSAGIVATFNGDVSVGTAPATAASLATDKGDIIPSTSTPAAVSSVATVRAAATASQVGNVVDNTDNSLELNLNLLIDDADISADAATIAVTGSFTLLYAIMSDD